MQLRPYQEEARSAVQHELEGQEENSSCPSNWLR